jgi:hypothetical protein
VREGERKGEEEGGETSSPSRLPPSHPLLPPSAPPSAPPSLALLYPPSATSLPKRTRCPPSISMIPPPPPPPPPIPPSIPACASSETRPAAFETAPPSAFKREEGREEGIEAEEVRRGREEEGGREEGREDGVPCGWCLRSICRRCLMPSLV